jgi:transcriptional regulator with XRE-family HTH domain
MSDESSLTNRKSKSVLENQNSEPFSQALRRLRKQRKLTMKKLADCVGVSESFISRLEAGERQPSKEFILQLGPIFFPEGNHAALDDLLIAADYTPLHMDGFTGRQDVISIFQEALTHNPHNFRAFISLIISLIRQGKFEIARNKIDEGFRLFDDQIQLQTLSSALELAHGNYAKAIVFQQEALRYFDLSVDVQHLEMQRQDLLLNLGVIYFLQGYEHLDDFIQFHAEQKLKAKKVAYKNAEQYLEQARHYFEEALQLAANDIYILDEYARVQFNLAYLQELAGQKFDYLDTIAGFKRVVHSQEKEKLSYHDLIESSLFLVHALAKSQQFDEAEHNINLIECCLPNYWLVHYLKACFFSLKYAIEADDILLELGLKSLMRAVAIEDENNRSRSEADVDPDLKSLRTFRASEFAKILKLEKKQ